MRIAALSDLHIGARDRGDPFGHGAAAFERFLDGLERDHDAIVLLGDVWQCDHALVPGRPAVQLGLARARSSWLSARLEDPRYHLVHGNHDEIAHTELSAPTHLVLGGVLFIHGHQFDPVIGAAPRTSATATWLAGRARALGLSGLAARGEDQDVQIKARRFQTPSGAYVAGARELLEAHDLGVVVMGHTHVQFDHGWTRPCGRPGRLLNCGTCSAGRFQWVSVQASGGELRRL